MGKRIYLPLLAFVFFGTLASAHQNNNNLYKPFKPELEKFAAKQMEEFKNPLPSQVLYNSEFISDDVIVGNAQGEHREVLERENEIKRVMDLMVRGEAPLAIVSGDTGVGKSEVVNEVVFRIAARKYPDSAAYREAFGNRVVLRANLRNLAPGGFDIAAYLSTVKFIQTELGRKIMVVFYEGQFLNDYMVSVINQYATSGPERVQIIVETDSKTYGNSVRGRHSSLDSLAESVMIREFNGEQTKKVVEQRAQDFATNYNLEITNELIDSVLDVAPDYRRDVHEPRRSQALLEDFLIAQNRAANGQRKQPTKIDLYRFVASQLGLPVIPQNEEEFSRYMQGVKDRLKTRVIGQDAIVDGVVDQFIAALTSRSRQHNIALLLGPTGVGKSLLGEILAEEFYGDKNRVLELDMTQYKEAYSMSTLFGANAGMVSSDKEKGVLCDFFDGRGKGGGIVILNEIEEMSADALTRFMEMWDKGTFPGGDGKTRYVGRTLFLLTSNKNSDRLVSYETIRGMARAELNKRLNGISQDQLKKAFTEKTSYTDDNAKVVKAAVLERVDRLYFASPLLKEEAVKVANIEINRFVKDYHKQSQTQLVIDPSLAEVMTSAFYNEALGARQIRTNVQQYLSRAIGEFKLEKGFDSNTLTISAKLHNSLKTVSYITITGDQGASLTIDGPKIPLTNRLLDADFRKRLVSLEEDMAKQIFGQPEAIHALAAAVKNRFLVADGGTAVAGFLLGVTGSGKSELAKVLAELLFNDRRAVGLFEMGRIQHQSDLNTILSPGKGIIGSDQPGELEQFLIQYPDGGVLLFDEMSNAGGQDKALKQAIAKQFYTMMQEGYYKSPSGKVYPLHDHIILFTGNDGEEIFKGLSSDSLLEETYKQAMKNPLFAKELLSKAGFTDAFIGRLAFSIFMRPTLGEVKIRIARKLIDAWRQSVHRVQPIDVELSEDFVEKVGRLTFSPKTGARSIEEFVKNTIGPRATDEALKQDWIPLLEEGRRMKVKLSVKTIEPDRPFYEGEKPDKTEAILVAETYIGDELKSTSKTVFTKKAFFMPQAGIKEAEATAAHEMGHAITSFSKITGKKVVKITIVPERIGEGMNAAGYCQYRSVPHQSTSDYKYLTANLAGLLAGSEAEKKYVGGISRLVEPALPGAPAPAADPDPADGRNTGRSNDLERVGTIAKTMILDLHLIPELDAAHAYVDKKGEITGNLPKGLRDKFDEYVAKAIADSRALANKTLDENWPLVEKGTQFLMQNRGVFSEKEYEKFEKLWLEAKAAGSEFNPDFDEIRRVEPRSHDDDDDCEEALEGA